MERQELMSTTPFQLVWKIHQALEVKTKKEIYG
jgi:hypothetical protein